MPLSTRHDYLAVKRTAPPDLDHLVKRIRVGRLADNAVREVFAAIGSPLQEFDSAVDRGPLFVAGNQQRQRAAWRPELRDIIESCRRERGDAALHVGGAAAKDHAISNLPSKRIKAPAREIARRNDIRVPSKDQVRRALADSREEIVDVRRARFGETHNVGRKIRFAEQRREIMQRPTLLGCDRRTPDQSLQNRDRVRTYMRSVGQLCRRGQRTYALTAEAS